MRKDWRKYFGLTQKPPDPPEEQKEFKAQLPGNQKNSGRFDPMSATWAFVETWAEEKLDKLRKKNDTSINTEKMSGVDRTILLRGEIKSLKNLLKLPEEVKNAQKKLNNN